MARTHRPLKLGAIVLSWPAWIHAGHSMPRACPDTAATRLDPSHRRSSSFALRDACLATILVFATLALGACTELYDQGGATSASSTIADPDSSRRVSELESAPRVAPRDRARATALLKEGRTKFARKPSADVAGAARALRESARLGDSEAQLLLAQNETLRPESERDVAASLTWLTRAAVRGNAPAQFQLAQDYATGRRVRREPSWADVWYERAARQGHREAMLTLGLRRAAGDGRDADELEAYRWLTQAVRAGAKQVERDRSDAAKLLTPEERSAIDAEISAWRSVSAEPSPDVALVRFLQAELVANGFDAGPADGRLGVRSQRALVAFKRTRGDINPSDEITASVAMALRDAAVKRVAR